MQKELMLTYTKEQLKDMIAAANEKGYSELDKRSRKDLVFDIMRSIIGQRDTYDWSRQVKSMLDAHCTGGRVTIAHKQSIISKVTGNNSLKGQNMTHKVVDATCDLLCSVAPQQVGIDLDDAMTNAKQYALTEKLRSMIEEAQAKIDMLSL